MPMKNHYDNESGPVCFHLSCGTSPYGRNRRGHEQSLNPRFGDLLQTLALVTVRSWRNDVFVPR